MPLWKGAAFFLTGSLSGQQRWQDEERVTQANVINNQVPAGFKIAPHVTLEDIIAAGVILVGAVKNFYKPTQRLTHFRGPPIA